MAHSEFVKELKSQIGMSAKELKAMFPKLAKLHGLSKDFWSLAFELIERQKLDDQITVNNDDSVENSVTVNNDDSVENSVTVNSDVNSQENDSVTKNENLDCLPLDSKLKSLNEKSCKKLQVGKRELLFSSELLALVINGTKTQTRRNWKPRTAKLFIDAFKERRLIKIYEFPYHPNKRKLKGYVLLTKEPYLQCISEMSADDIEKEGCAGMTLSEFFNKYFSSIVGDLHDYFPALISDVQLWVLDFKFVPYTDEYVASGQEMTDYFLSGRRDDEYYESFRDDWEQYCDEHDYDY
jgi:hypothetical protein